ncbi:MAG TPA: hypothetical protein VGP27_07670 [Mycobacterium sp.]|nr:hypothetical protein [Mycobacterium sp.]
MSGFDTSQPIADENSLKDVDTVKKTPDDESAAEKDAVGSTNPDELGDATPGPR